MRKTIIIIPTMALCAFLVLAYVGISALQYVPKASMNEERSLRSIVNSMNLSNVAILDVENSNVVGQGKFEILFIDGWWLEGNLDNETVVSSVSNIIFGKIPTVVFGNANSAYLYGMLNESIRETSNQPLVACGIYFDGRMNHWMFFGGTALTKEVVSDAYQWACARTAMPSEYA